VSSGRVIAVVEDDVDLRETVEEILAHAGYRPIGFSDARDALAELRALETLPALVLLDLMMPGMNGWEFRDEQVRDPALRHVPVVVMTASTGLDRNPIRVNEILRKPVEIRVLLEAVARNAA
jgi:CheY-like chemotaxis protein